MIFDCAPALVKRDRTSKSLSRTRLEPAQLCAFASGYGTAAAALRSSGARFRRAPDARPHWLNGAIPLLLRPSRRAYRGLLASVLRTSMARSGSRVSSRSIGSIEVDEIIHALATFARLPGPGGMRSVMAESLLIKHQLLVINRSRHRAAVVIKPSTLLKFHAD